jgi:acetoacetate decarboxylase
MMEVGKVSYNKWKRLRLSLEDAAAESLNSMNFLFKPLPNWLGKAARVCEIALAVLIMAFFLISLLLYIHELLVPGSVID